MNKKVVSALGGLILTISLHSCPECGGTCGGEPQKVFKNQINKSTGTSCGGTRVLPNEVDRNRPKERAKFVATLTLALDALKKPNRDLATTREVINNHGLKEEFKKLLKHLQRGPLDKVWHSADEIFKLQAIQKHLDEFMYRNDEKELKQFTTELDNLKTMLEQDIEELTKNLPS